MNYEEFFTDQAGMLPFFKMGIQGEAGSGKSYTMAKVAAGLHRFVKSDKPIVLFDTENTAGFIVPRFNEAKIKVRVRQTRSLTDLSKAMDFCESGEAGILLIDSITHIWDNFLKAFKEAKGRTFIQFQDWGELKPTWKEQFSDRMVLAQYHVIFTGRQGDIYQYQEDEGTGRRELVKTGIKMRTEKETPYEPDVLVLMERHESLLGKEKEIYRNATVLKDRAAVIDGKVFKNPGFSCFKPSIEFVMQNKSEKGVVTPGDDRDLVQRSENDSEQKREAAKYYERAMNLLDFHAGGQKKEEKTRRFKALEYAFGDTSDTAIKAIGKERLMEGYLKLQEFFSDEKKDKLTNGQKANGAAPPIDNQAPPEDGQAPPDEPSPGPPEAGHQADPGEEEAKKKQQRRSFAEAVLVDGKCMNRQCVSTDKRNQAALHPHHLVPRSQRGPDEVENGITLCVLCHKRAHEGYQSAQGRVTGRRFLLTVLEGWRGELQWRWDKPYEWLRKKETE